MVLFHLLVVSILTTGVDPEDDVKQLRSFHARYRATTNTKEKFKLRSAISKLLNSVDDSKSPAVVEAVAAFFEFPELDSYVTRTLIAIETQEARNAIQGALEEEPSKNKHSSFDRCRRAQILKLCEDVTKSFSTEVMKKILLNDPHEDGVEAALDFLAPRLTHAKTLAILGALQEARGTDGIAQFEPSDQEDKVVGVLVRGFQLKGQSPQKKDGEGGEKPEKKTGKGALGSASNPRKMTDATAGKIYQELLTWASDASRKSVARGVSMRVLAEQKRKEVLKVIQGVLEEKKSRPPLTLSATRAAVALGDPAAGAWVLPVIKKWSRSSSGRGYVEEDLAELIESIYPLRIEEAAPIVLKALRSKRLALRVAAITALPMLGEKKAKSQLGKALSHSHWRIRNAAIESCRRFKSAFAVDLLIDRMKKEEGRLQHDLLMALHELTGVYMPYVSADWKKWWGVSRESYKPPDKYSPVSESTTVVLFPDASKSTYFGMRVLSKRLCFVLDTSGSMSTRFNYEGRQAARIEVMKNELVRLVKTFKSKTYFNVYFFHTDYQKLFPNLVRLTRRNYTGVQKFVENAKAQGATNLYDPLAEALQDPYADTIYLLSDGSPSAGKITDPERILTAVKKMNRQRGIQINTISIGTDSDFMKKLARQNSGIYRHISGSKPGP